ncbi:EmrB/QacA subfamily drug resistance transporter [Nocardioides thalensis]|uniref:EmrB/QacA subfamily drug resistance transporter n=1 Tax=Nocardioides thalensis TaxID=1914755 RepID=A0A853C3R9_9ACTN|nr:MFS transporter [Nocardioides thalensis]NYJ00953.1 EmrB/QacA subfamily drug resistance transporter [Nocardioides thalensis]
MTSTPASAATETTSPAPDPRRWSTLALLGIAQLMLIVDVTVVAIALPHMGADLGLDREATTWVVSAYTLAFGGLMLLGGRAADILGTRAVVLTGLGVFTGASLVSGLAETPELLIGGRVAQGLGAALLSPAALAAVLHLFEGEERNRAMGIWSALGGGGAALGVLLGGVLTAGPGWPWVFFVNVPIGIVVTVVLTRRLPRAATRSASGVDVLGAALVTAATGTGIYALIGAGDRGWTDGTTLLLLAGSVVLYLLFGLRQRTARTPLMDLGLLARRPVASGTFLIVSATALMVAGFFLGTFYLQHHAGKGALLTGVLFLPIAIATMAGATAGGHLIARTGARVLAASGFVVAALGFSVPALLDGATAVVVGIAGGALGLGVLFVAASATALGMIAPHEAGIASGIVSTFHEFGASLGAAVISSVAAASIAGSTAAGFTDGFTLAAAVAATAALVSLVLVPGRTTGSVPHTGGLH